MLSQLNLDEIKSHLDAYLLGSAHKYLISYKRIPNPDYLRVWLQLVLDKHNIESCTIFESSDGSMSLCNVLYSDNCKTPFKIEWKDGEENKSPFSIQSASLIL